MEKELALKYIKDRQFELIIDQRITKKEKVREKLKKEYEFLSFAKECIESYDPEEFAEEIYTHEHNGYVLQQSSYNWHYMIFKNGKMVVHCQCNYKLSKEEAHKLIEEWERFREEL